MTPRFDIRKKAATVAVLVAGATLAGPFGTYEELTLAQRFLYWFCAIAGCGLIMEGLVLTALTHPILRLPGWARLGAAVLIGSFPAALIVLSLEYGLRGYTPTPEFALRIWALVVGIALLITLVEYRSALRDRSTPRTPGAKPVPERSSPGALFFRALDPALGQDLISLSKQDHYLEVVTQAGQTVILKRMADAMAELERYPGLQIHRSHWIALAALDRLEREDHRWVARLTDGRALPVSRPNIPILREMLAGREGDTTMKGALA